MTAAGSAGHDDRALTSEGRAAEVERLIAPTLGDMGYDIVRVQLGGGQRQLLQVMAERGDGGGMTVDDCAEISRAVSASKQQGMTCSPGSASSARSRSDGGAGVDGDMRARVARRPRPRPQPSGGPFTGRRTSKTAPRPGVE